MKNFEVALLDDGTGGAGVGGMLDLTADVGFDTIVGWVPGE
jgi:hypothetical protein